MTAATTAAGKPRLAGLDALRGIAAMLVVLFHYTTRYDELYRHSGTPLFALPWGHLGVNLFFMISGFVIFMTLQKTVRPLDFVVSRFSRLYPAYWVAVALTFALVAALGLPGKEVSAGTAALNLAMFHSLFNVPHVDGVYWTLEVELLFYGWALLAFRLGLLPRVHWLLGLLLGLRLVYFGCAELLHVDLPWMISRLLILKYIPWFAAGIAVFRLTTRCATPRRELGTLAAVAAVLWLMDGWLMGALVLALSGVLFAATRGHLGWLGHPLLVGLGTISYTLYLVHENIGWAMILRLEKAGMDANLAIALALAAAVGLASLLTWLVERPAMAWVRQRYRQRQARRGAAASATGR